ncbi:hypothetical protein G3O01_08695 [Burkholderia sp. Ac-20365]|nr:hypothetical protein [Burkholderia sp. Ac-20365]
MRRRAAFWKDQYPKGDSGYCEPDGAYWRLIDDYPLALFGEAGEWVRFFDSEVANWTADGDPNRFDDILTEAIREPVVALDSGGIRYVWDGNHRIGGSFKAGRLTIPAIIGVPFSAGGHYVAAICEGCASVESSDDLSARLRLLPPDGTSDVVSVDRTYVAPFLPPA